MGQQMTFEIGRLNIGRIVRVMRVSDNQHAMIGKLVGAHRDYAIVKPIGRTNIADEKIDWRNVLDCTSRNPVALVMPAPKTTSPVAVEPKPMMTMQPQTMTKKNAAHLADAKAKIAEALNEAGVMDMGDVGDRVKAAIAKVKQAEADYADLKRMCDEDLAKAKAKIDEARASLSELRQAAETLLDMIDKA
jgi:hypothetical protein